MLYFMRYVQAQAVLDHSYKIYISDQEQLKAENKYHSQRWSDRFTAPQKAKSGEEVVDGLMQKMGIK